MPEFLLEGQAPFALGKCEKFAVGEVSGSYNEREQVWEGSGVDVASLTLTLTATPGDNDQDRD